MSEGTNMRNNHWDLSFEKMNADKAWLLGFLFSDATIGNHLGNRVIRLFNKHRSLLEYVKEHYQVPYTIGSQKHKKSTVYFLRFQSSGFVSSVEAFGYQKDKTMLRVPELGHAAKRNFLKGFLIGKGSFYQEKDTGAYGFKVVYRSRIFMEDLACLLSELCEVRIATPHCRFIKNVESCQLKYAGQECDRIQAFLKSGFVLDKSTFSSFWEND